jgi:hypothetical protein
MTSDFANAFKKLQTNSNQETLRSRQEELDSNLEGQDFTQEKIDSTQETLDSAGWEKPQQPVDTSAKLSQNQTSSMKFSSSKNLKMYLVLGLIALVAGIGTGYGGYQLQAQSGLSTKNNSTENIQKVAGSNISAGDVFGIDDIDTFGDSAQGYLEAGGLEGEGSHQLLRPGGVSQTVYLTSSITDLNPLVGMQVKVYGETFKGQKAGWLMDVGRVEVIKVDGDKPIID